MRSISRKADFVIYIVIGLAVIGLAFVLAYLHVGSANVIRWGGLGIGTLIVYGGFVCYSQAFIHKSLFWGMTLVAIVLHLASFITILQRIADWKLPWFMVMVLEVPLLLFLRDKLLSNQVSIADSR